MAGSPPSAQALPLELVSINGSAVRLRTATGGLELRHDAGNLAARDWAQHELQLAMEESDQGRFRVNDPRFADLACTVGRINGKPALAVRNQAYVLNFLLLDSGIRLALKTGRVVPAEPVRTFGFTGKEALGSGRGFIWSRSLPLLRKTLMVGFGPDTFAMVFPQHDFSGKFRVYGTTDMLVDKPHNFFLQTALNTGVLSAMALLLLFGWYVAAGVRLQMRAPAEATNGGMSLACLVGVIGYLGASLFNDSVVSVAPVFWALLGVGIRMNLEHGRVSH
jgi:hypothetical protein